GFPSRTEWAGLWMDQTVEVAVLVHPVGPRRHCCVRGDTSKYAGAPHPRPSVSALLPSPPIPSTTMIVSEDRAQLSSRSSSLRRPTKALVRVYSGTAYNSGGGGSLTTTTAGRINWTRRRCNEIRTSSRSLPGESKNPQISDA